MTRIKPGTRACVRSHGLLSLLLTVVALLATADGLGAWVPASGFVASAHLVALSIQQASNTQDSDRDGVRDVRDACPGTRPGVDVDETGCEPSGAGAWLPWIVGIGVLLLVAFGVARWWFDQPVEVGAPAGQDWVVLPVSSAANDAGIKPAPRAHAPPAGPPAPGAYPSQRGAAQPGYPAAPGYPPPQPGYPPQPWPAQPGYYPPPNYPAPGYGAPGGYSAPPGAAPPGQPQVGPPQGLPPGARPPARSDADRVAAPPPPGPGGGFRSSPGVPTEPPTGVPAQPAASGAGGVEPIPEGEQVDEGQVRFHRAPEGTLQLLPGRLDVVGGDPGRGGIRFVKIPTEEPEVTFGRSAGPQYRHIQLKIPTVSRMHARMWFTDGVWSIENLSETNPVVVNGDRMGLGTAGSLSLNDGDRIEMGEVVFRYWI